MPVAIIRDLHAAHRHLYFSFECWIACLLLAQAHTVRCVTPKSRGLLLLPAPGCPADTVMLLTNNEVHVLTSQKKGVYTWRFAKGLACISRQAGALHLAPGPLKSS